MESTRWIVGPQEFVFEAPDVFHGYVNANIQISEVKAMYEIISKKVFPEVGKVFYILHLASKVSGFTPEARKYAGTLGTDEFKGMLVVGGSAMGRAAFTIFNNALRLLGKKEEKGPPMRMFRNVEDAYAFIKECRTADQANAVQS